MSFIHGYRNDACLHYTHWEEASAKKEKTTVMFINFRPLYFELLAKKTQTMLSPKKSVVLFQVRLQGGAGRATHGQLREGAVGCHQSILFRTYVVE